jgi:hypothetical protein
MRKCSTNGYSLELALTQGTHARDAPIIKVNPGFELLMLLLVQLPQDLMLIAAKSYIFYNSIQFKTREALVSRCTLT